MWKLVVNGSAALQADAAHRMTDRSFGGDMDGVGMDALEPALDVARARPATILFPDSPAAATSRNRRAQKFQIGAQRARFPRHVPQSAHHTVDLRMPGIGGDQDFHASSTLPCRPATFGSCCLHLAQHRRDFVAGVRPGDDFKLAVVALGHGRAAFDPIAAVDVTQAEIVMDGGGVDVAADHAIDVVMLGFGRQRLLEGADIIDRVLDLQLGPFRQRPIRRAEARGASR